MIIVTAHLAKPLDMKRQTLPGESFKEPSDYEFYMMGLLEGQNDKKSVASAQEINKPAAGTVVRPENGFDGEFGHSWPK